MRPVTLRRQPEPGRSHGEAGAPQAGFTECLNNMQQGKVAMWYDATSAAGSLESEESPVAGKVGYAPAPVEKTKSSGWLGYDILRGSLASHVLIYGSGTMGLMMMELAKRTGAATVDMVDINEDGSPPPAPSAAATR
jgi:hypothetical protein